MKRRAAPPLPEVPLFFSRCVQTVVLTVGERHSACACQAPIFTALAPDAWPSPFFGPGAACALCTLRAQPLRFRAAPVCAQPVGPASPHGRAKLHGQSLAPGGPDAVGVWGDPAVVGSRRMHPNLHATTQREQRVAHELVDFWIAGFARAEHVQAANSTLCVRLLQHSHPELAVEIYGKFHVSPSLLPTRRWKSRGGEGYDTAGGGDASGLPTGPCFCALPRSARVNIIIPCKLRHA